MPNILLHRFMPEYWVKGDLFNKIFPIKVFFTKNEALQNNFKQYISLTFFLVILGTILFLKLENLRIIRIMI